MVATRSQVQRERGLSYGPVLSSVTEAMRFRLVGSLQDPDAFSYVQRMTAVVMARFSCHEQVVFGAELYAHRHGFLALEAIQWGNSEQSRGWVETEGVLYGLLEIGLIERL